jgi:hypothetical protein
MGAEPGGGRSRRLCGRRRATPWRNLRLAAAAAGSAAVALASPAVGAGATPPTVLDPHGLAVSAYGGWAAWSRSDPATGQFALVVRSPQGAISLPAVAERAAPFDVELGPSGGGGVAAVYSRCTDVKRLQGCQITELPLTATGAPERTLSPPGGGSNHEPAIWNRALVFLRRNPAGGSRRPERLYSWSIGAGRAQALALPVSRGFRGAGQSWPAGLTGLITGLGFNGKQVGYVTSNTVGTFGLSTLWFQPLGRRAELIDQVTGGAGNICEPKFLSPVLAGPWLYAYLHPCNAELDRLTRYRHGQVQNAAYRFRLLDEEISSAVIDGAGLDWDVEAQVEHLASVSWRTIKAPVADTFCSRSDPFC